MWHRRQVAEVGAAAAVAAPKGGEGPAVEDPGVGSDLIDKCKVVPRSSFAKLVYITPISLGCLLWGLYYYILPMVYKPTDRTGGGTTLCGISLKIDHLEMNIEISWDSLNSKKSQT